MSLNSLLDIIVMNALLHGEVQFVAHDEVILTTAFPSQEGKYNTTAQVLKMPLALQRVLQALKSNKRIKAVEALVKQQKELRKGPVVILLCNGIKKLSKGRHSAPDDVIAWTTTCPWLD
jgi:hypothetical protein